MNSPGMKLVLAPGAADTSEGMVYLEEGPATCDNAVVGEPFLSEKTAVVYKNYTDQQPGEGFWAAAPGCGDISEGRVWVAVQRSGE